MKKAPLFWQWIFHVVNISDSVFMNAELTLVPDNFEIFVDVHSGGRGGIKANVNACGQRGRGGEILLKLCGHNKCMPPYKMWIAEHLFK